MIWSGKPSSRMISDSVVDSAKVRINTGSTV